MSLQNTKLMQPTVIKSKYCYIHHKGQAQGHKVIYLGVIMKGLHQ